MKVASSAKSYRPFGDDVRYCQAEVFVAEPTHKAVAHCYDPIVGLHKTMITLNLNQAKTDLSDCVAQAEAGETVIICKRNKPVAMDESLSAGYPHVFVGVGR